MNTVRWHFPFYLAWYPSTLSRIILGLLNIRLKIHPPKNRKCVQGNDRVNYGYASDRLANRYNWRLVSRVHAVMSPLSVGELLNISFADEPSLRQGIHSIWLDPDGIRLAASDHPSSSSLRHRRSPPSIVSASVCPTQARLRGTRVEPRASTLATVFYARR
jgi:hypothetical protein